MKKMLRKSMFLVALLVSFCMPVVAQNANTTLNLDQVSGTNVLSTSGSPLSNVYYIQNVATGLYLKAGGEWGTNAVEGRAAHPFYLEKRTDGSYAISSVAGYFHSTDMWADWKLRNDSRWTITKVSGLASGVNQFYLVNANGRALSSQGHITGQLMMDKHHAASYAQKWIFITEAQMKEQMSGATATKPMDITPLIKASSFDLVDGIVMNDPDDANPWKDDSGNNISSLPLYSKLTQAAYNRYWSNFATRGRFNWHSMIRGEWGQTSVYNGVGIISEGNMSNSINVTQTVNSLPKGKYYFSFEGFYRYQTRSGWGGLLDAIVGAFSDIKFQVVISAGNKTIKTFDLRSNTNIAIDSEPVEKAGQEVAKVFRDNDNYKQFYEFDLTSQSDVTITISKTSTSSSNAWICVDNFALVYYGDESNTPDVEDLSELYNSRLEAYIEKIRNELSNYPGASTELRNQALGVFNDGIVDVEDAMDNKIITTEELYREALSVIDQAYREALALLNKPVEGDYTHLIGNPSFEIAASNNNAVAASWLNASREKNGLATDQSYIGSSTGVPLVQKVNNLPYGLYRMTADVTAAVGNTVYLMGNYYHKGVQITNANKLETVELYFLLDDGYNGDLDGKLSTVLGVIGGSGDGNKYYNFRGIETVNNTESKQVSEDLSKDFTPEVKSNVSVELGDNKGSIKYDGSQGTSDNGFVLKAGKQLSISVEPVSNENLTITKVTLTCSASNRKGSGHTASSGVSITYPSSTNNVVLTPSGGTTTLWVKNGGNAEKMRISKITVECTRTYTTEEVVGTKDQVQEPVVQGCPFKVDNFKLYRVSDVPNGRLFMELQKARNAKFTDGVTADIAQYEAMFQNRLVDNTGPGIHVGTDFGYNPAQRVMEILRNAAKQQRSAGADMTYAIFNQNFDYWWGNGANLGYAEGWFVLSKGTDGDGDTGDKINHFGYTTSSTDGEGKVLFNTWGWLADHEGTGAHLAQKIEGIPNGRYRLQAVVASGDLGKAGTIYLTAQTGAQTEVYKNSVVDNSAGKLLNEISLEFDVTDGKATIGVVGGSVTDGSFVAPEDETKHRLWYKADNFRLTYLGKQITFNEKDTQIEQVQDHYTQVTVNRTLKANNTWSSFVVPFDIPADVLAGWDVKELVGSELQNEGKHLSLVFDDAMDGIKAGIPYMVRNTSMTENLTSIVVNNVNVDTKTLNNRVAGDVAFVGVYARQDVPYAAYFISSNKFYKSSNKNNPDHISGFRGYFQLLENERTANVQSLGYRIVGEGETDIEEIVLEEDLEVLGVYDVDGTRLNGTKPGINILRMSNGTTKKVLVK